MLAREHLAGPRHARLDLVGDEDDAVLPAVFGQPGQESLTGDDHATFTLHGLGQHARDAVPTDLLVHGGDRKLRAGFATQLRRRSSGAAVGVAERHAVDLGCERPESRLVRHRLGGERHREQRPAVERMVEHHHRLTAGE